MSLNIRNIGIVAHVDAGKTTLTEYLLYRGGSIRNLGSVDKGTAFTDSMEIERQRGISVKAAEAVILHENVEIHIIDTPGHADFSGEVERALSILDGAVVVISAVEGVQPQTEVYFEALKAMKIPTIIFINKIDRIGSNAERVIDEIIDKLTPKAVFLQQAESEGSKEPIVKNLLDAGKVDNKLIENLCDFDEEIMLKYLDGETFSKEYIQNKISRLTQDCNIYPILCGAALKGLGVDDLLNALIEYLPEPSSNDDEKLSGIVFKIAQDKVMGRMAYVRLFSGKISPRDMVYNYSKDTNEKATQIRKLYQQRVIDTGELQGGEIGYITGLSSAAVGDIIGCSDYLRRVPNIATPLLTFQVTPKLESELNNLVEAMHRLEEEDPLLHVKWIKEKKEIHINIMGMIQVEILQNILFERFGLEVEFSKPSVIYKETPSKKGIGFDAYTMPKPCWAIVKLDIEPLERGSGLVYESKVGVNDVKVRYQREVEKQLPIVLEQGIYGWQVIDLKVTFSEGEDHYMHSRPGDFGAATSMAIMKGLAETGTTLLEPILHFKITAPEDIGGKILGDIIQMRGSFESPSISNGNFIIEGEIPVATSLEYPVRLGIISGGRAVLNTKFSGYKECPKELGAVRERIGVNPLDRDKYILYVRNAILD